MVKAFSIRSHHHTKRATNDDSSLHRFHHHLPHHSHTTAAGIAALAANASFAGNLTLPANAAFARRQRLRWAQPPPPSPSPPANPPANDSTNPSPHRLRRNRDDYGESGGRCYRGGVGRATPLGGAEVLRKGARGGVTGGGGGRCEGPAMNDYSRESGSVGEGGGRQRYRRGRR